MSFKAAEQGGVTGALQVRSNAANYGVVGLSMTGQGTNASAAEASFLAIPVGAAPAGVVAVTSDSAVLGVSRHLRTRLRH